MRRIFIGISLMPFIMGCLGGGNVHIHGNKNNGYETKKKEGIHYHQNNIQHLIIKEPGGNPNR